MQNYRDFCHVLSRAETFGIHPVHKLPPPPPVPCTPLLNPSSPHFELKSNRKPESSVPIQLLALVLSGSTAAQLVRSQANTYLVGIMKIDKYKVLFFLKQFLTPNPRANWFIAQVLTEVELNV